MKKAAKKEIGKYLNDGKVLQGHNIPEAATFLSGEVEQVHGLGSCPITEAIAILRGEFRQRALVSDFEQGLGVIGYRRPTEDELRRAQAGVTRRRRQTRSRWRRTHWHNPRTRQPVLRLMGLDQVRQDLKAA